MKYRKSLHIFRRDLRLEDNTALLNALEDSEKVIACFIFDGRQIKNNDYFSMNAFQFMIESLEELDSKLKKKGSKLYVFTGKAETVVDILIKQEKIDAVFINGDYTPFSLKRDKEIEKACEKNNVLFHSFHDLLLTPPGSITKGDGKPYTVFTPFYRKASLTPVSKPQKNTFSNYYSGKIVGSADLSVVNSVLKKRNEKLYVNGGRSVALKQLKHISDYYNYKEDRNFPWMKGTTGLSAHNKFGTISIREFYYALKDVFGCNNELIRQLYWRDFFSQIVYHFPYVFGGSFNKKYDKILWPNNKNLFEAWCIGKTGFPIVDAGMRELNETGYMHNRTRMIVASFLVKDLHIDWRWGEKYFAQKLVDYDPCVNNGSWQWAASTGCDAQPYFRIFNPWLQQKKFDVDCKYIKKWIPELRDFDSKHIHDLEGNHLEGYPEQVVVHKDEKEVALAMFKVL